MTNKVINPPIIDPIYPPQNPAQSFSPVTGSIYDSDKPYTPKGTHTKMITPFSLKSLHQISPRLLYIALLFLL